MHFTTRRPPNNGDGYFMGGGSLTEHPPGRGRRPSTHPGEMPYRMVEPDRRHANGRGGIIGERGIPGETIGFSSTMGEFGDHDLAPKGPSHMMGTAGGFGHAARGRSKMMNDFDIPSEYGRPPPVIEELGSGGRASKVPRTLWDFEIPAETGARSSPMDAFECPPPPRRSSQRLGPSSLPDPSRQVPRMMGGGPMHQDRTRLDRYRFEDEGQEDMGPRDGRRSPTYEELDGRRFWERHGRENMPRSGRSRNSHASTHHEGSFREMGEEEEGDYEIEHGQISNGEWKALKFGPTQADGWRYAENPQRKHKHKKHRRRHHCRGFVMMDY